MDAWLAIHRADLIVLDVVLPGESGLSIVNRLKSSLSIPVLMLSARGGEIDRIRGLAMGADDYLAKPFHPRELLARIHARLREATNASLPCLADLRQRDLPKPLLDSLHCGTPCT